MEITSRKKFGIGIIIGAFLVVLSILFLVMHKTTESNFACDYPQYKKINNSMSKEEVQKILGTATRDVVKIDITKSRFGQGQLENQIKEGWIYDLPSNWRGGLEIYFNKDEKVIGKNCGYG